MASVRIQESDIADGDLVFDDAETRMILKFFWPQRVEAIDTLPVDNDIRRFAQAALISAIDASYAMGYIDILTNVLVRRRPGTSIKAWGKKLARKFVKHWWKHATQKDLMQAVIYESVRLSIANAWRFRLEDLIRERVVRGKGPAPIALACQTKRMGVWV